MTAHSWDEHLDQLAAALGAAATCTRARIERFLERFVRPHGLRPPAAPLAAEAVEEAAAMQPKPSGQLRDAACPRPLARLSPDWKRPARRLRRRLRSLA